MGVAWCMPSGTHRRNALDCGAGQNDVQHGVTAAQGYLFTSLARPAGLEPTTNGLEGRCSVH